MVRDVLKKKEPKEEETNRVNRVLDDIGERIRDILDKGKTTRPGYIKELADLAIAKKKPTKIEKMPSPQLRDMENIQVTEAAVKYAENLNMMLEKSQSEKARLRIDIWVKTGTG